MEENSQITAFTLILHAGNSKSSCMEALTACDEQDFDLVEKKLKEASEELTEAHQLQTDLLTKMTRGENVPVDILMVHAQDHLSNAILIHDLAKQLISMKKEIQELRKTINEK